MSEFEPVEFAVFEVLVDGKWVEYNRIAREIGCYFHEMMLSKIQPETRIRFEEAE